jgi:MFS family permease
MSFIAIGLPAIGPQLRDDFGLTLAELGAVLTAALLGVGLALIPAGILIARVGPRAAVIGGIALATAGLATAAFAPSKALLVASLFLSGVGLSVIPVAGAAALLRVYPAARRGRAYAVRQTAAPLGGALAAVLLPLLQAVGGVELALLVGAVLVATTGAGFALVAVAEAMPASHPTRPFRSILDVPGMRRLLLVACFYIIVLQALLAYAVPAARASGLSAFAASAAFLAVNLTAIVSRVFWGGAADRGGGARRARTLVETGAVAAVGAVLFALALHAGAVAVVLAAVVFGLGALGWNAIVYVTAGERAPPGLGGRSFALAATVVFVVSALCTPPLGALASHAGWDTLWITTAAIAAVGAAIASRLPRTVPS